ncbi:hypothetical protein ASZ90_010039 [hydrocarbon metagenome]|uniref:Uncharacterized protein n=1 Tax=hydrocarbon metagenome TaxID=938273 RepID=A0A0W8FH61_9ZZZZ
MRHDRGYSSRPAPGKGLSEMPPHFILDYIDIPETGYRNFGIFM